MCNPLWSIKLVPEAILVGSPLLHPSDDKIVGMCSALLYQTIQRHTVAFDLQNRTAQQWCSTQLLVIPSRLLAEGRTALNTLHSVVDVMALMKHLSLLPLHSALTLLATLLLLLARSPLRELPKHMRHDDAGVPSARQCVLRAGRHAAASSILVAEPGAQSHDIHPIEAAPHSEVGPGSCNLALGSSGAIVTSPLQEQVCYG